jgi:hypothetical protein
MVPVYFTDDAGAATKFRIVKADPLNWIERFVVSRRAFYAAACVCLLGPGILLAMSMGGVFVPPVAFIGTCAAGLVLGVWASIVRTRLQPALVRTRVARGRCGACGGDIPRDNPDAQGLVACKSCASRWKLTTSANSDERDQLALYKKRPEGPWILTDWGGVARGEKPITPRARAVIRGIDAENAARNYLLWGIGVGALTSVLVTLWVYSKFSSMLNACWQFALAWSFLMGSTTPWMKYVRLLACGLCPECGADLPITTAPIVDGRGSVKCAQCKSAWPEVRVLRYPIPPDPCRTCTLDRGGAKRCQVCEGDKAARANAVAGMSPRCAECNAALPGPDRVCPRCGVMAGTRYV